MAGLIAATAAPGLAGVARATPTTPTTPTSPKATTPLTVEQALAQARSSRSRVAVPAATTPTDTVTANPDGTLTLSRFVRPVRKQVNGSWHNLDATLHANGHGGVSPAMTTNGLILSGGGSGPLVTMTNGTHSLDLSLPVSLPAPTLSGPTATYPSVLPGVDLQITVSAQGGFSEVFVVHSAAAAASATLAALAVAVRATGLTLSKDDANNLTMADAAGRVVFTAPAPMMWDSSPDATVAPVTDPASGARVDPTTGQPVASSPAGPGKSAHVATVATTAAAGRITLTPSQKLFTATDTVYPVFVDPTWSSVSGSKSAWASVSEYHPSTNYYNKTPDPEGEMQVGNSGSMWSHTLINFPISSALSGATIQSATLSITDVWSYSCTASSVNVYAPSTTLSSSNATWNYWAGVNLGSAITSKSFAHGYSSSCPAAGENFNVLAGVTAALSAHRSTQTFVLTGVNESSDHNSWKEFSPSTPNLTVTYNHTPNTPTGLSTAPSTACAATPPSVVGDGSVSLYAPVSDPDGGSLSVYFSLWKTSDSTKAQIWPAAGSSLTYSSGSVAVGVVPAATFQAHMDGTTTEFSWHVQASDGIAASAWSTTCNLVFDSSRPAAPTITANPADVHGGVVGQIGQPITFTITAPVTGTPPASYLYQLNAAPPLTVAADGSGNATVTVHPSRMTNALAVTSLSAGGNVGQSISYPFSSAAPASPTDADLTGDGVPDLLTAGAQNGLPAGLWQAANLAASSAAPPGRVNPAATNIGATGNGSHNDYSPADFTKAQVVTGKFTTSGLQDILLYYPTGYAGDTDTSNYGTAILLPDNGDGSPLQGQADNATRLPPGTLVDNNSDNPSQLANAGNTAGQNYAYPDLIGVSGDSLTGYYLDYYPNGNQVGGYGMVEQLDTATPAGDMAWDDWTIATCQLSTGTAMFLWNTTTGALYLWTALSHPLGSTTLNYTPYTIANGTTSTWNKNATLTLQAADTNNDATADLWAVGPNATLTAWTTSNLSGGTASITPQPSQTLFTGNHAWSLADNPAAGDESSVTTTADATGGLTLTGTNALWNHGDALYTTDVQLNNGYLSTAGKAVDTNQDFTVSIWAKPAASGGTVIAENGAHVAALRVWSNAADSSWRFAMTTSDAYGAGTDTAIAPAGSAKLNMWIRLTATYRKATGAMNLYLGNVNAATATHTTTWTPGSGNPLTIGAYLNATSATSSTLTADYAGEVAQAQTWTQIADPTTTNVTTPPTSIWGMDDAATGDPNTNVAHDATRQHDAALTSGASWATPGHNAGDPGALSLNGTTGAAATTGPALSTHPSFTVAAWVKLATTASTLQIAVSQAGTYTHAFRLGYGGNTNWTFRTVPIDAVNASGSTLNSPAGTATAGTWTFITGVWNATTSTMSLYVNATLVSSAVVNAPFAATGSLSMGREWNNSAYDAYLGGQIDDVRAYPTALSPAAIVALDPTTAVYHLDDGSGTIAHDTGKLHDAPLSASGATWVTPGHRGSDPGALALNGSTGAATTSGPVLDTDQSFTVSAWAKLTATGGTNTQAVLGQGGIYTHAYQLLYNPSDNSWRFRTVSVDATNGSGSSLTATGAVAGQWTFLAGVWNAATSTMTLYVNGAPIVHATVGVPFAATGAQTIGRVWVNSAYSGYFNGQIDEARAYQTALSDTDIQNLYANN